MTVYHSYLNLTDSNLPISLQENLDVDHNCQNTPWKNALDSETNQLLHRNIHININNPSVIPILKIKDDGLLKIRLCYPVNDIYSIYLQEGGNCISLLEGDNCNNCNNEDYCINYTGLVITCNYSLLTYFFDHDD